MNKIKRVGEKKSERPIKVGDIFLKIDKTSDGDPYWILTRIEGFKGMTYYGLANITNGDHCITSESLEVIVHHIESSDLIRLEKGDKIEIEVQ
jgi:hypothetical protein